MPLPDKQTLEREVKLSVKRDFVLPQIPGEPLPPQVFTSTYFDTENYQLAQAGITLRYRAKAREGTWQLKLPQDTARLELEFAGDLTQPPDSLIKLLFAHLRGQSIKPVARLRTRRTWIRVSGLKKPSADVVVDSVVALEGRRVKCRLYELEVELLGGNDTDLRRIEKTLREAGALDGDPRPKVFQVLGLGLPVPIDSVLPSSSPPIEHFKASLRTQVKLILAHDPGTRLGTDPEELHKMRVATRRLRAYLRAAQSMLVPNWPEHIRTEVAWLSSTLGPVRDLDVLLGHLDKECSILRVPERRAVEGLLERLQQQRMAARVTLLEALESDRYLALLEGLETGVLSPAVGDAAVSLADIARAEFKKLRRAIKTSGLDASDTVLHRIRIKGKRARYAGELAQTCVGKPARRFLRRAKVFQDLLGDHHDAVVTEQRLRKLLGQATAG
ncbi:MAG: CYTH and CHAD domain-containing protein [Nitrospirota bacterium]